MDGRMGNIPPDHGKTCTGLAKCTRDSLLLTTGHLPLNCLSTVHKQVVVSHINSGHFKQTCDGMI